MSVSAAVGADLRSVESRLHWEDGKSLDVQLESISSDRRLTTAAGELNVEGLSALIFRHPANTNALARPVTLVELRDGGRIGGAVRRMDREFVVFDSAAGERFELPTTAVKSIRWTDTPTGVSFEGSFNTNKWVVGRKESSPLEASEPAWSFEDGIYVSQGRGTLTCECDMPLVARVEFDLHWQDKPRFRLAFFARDSLNYVDSEGYHFFSSGSGSIYAMTRGRNPTKGIKMTRANIPSMVSSNYVRLDFRVNSQSGEGWLFANGKEIRHWTDLGYSGVGTGLMFFNYHAATRIGIANLRVSEWDGRTAHPPEPSSRLQTVVFRNGDTMETTKLSLAGTNATFRFNDSMITIATDRLAQIYLPGYLNVIPSADTVWVHSLQGDWIRGEIEALDNGFLHWRDGLTRTRRKTSIRHIRGIHYAQQKPVMDLLWYLPKMRPPRETE